MTAAEAARISEANDGEHAARFAEHFDAVLGLFLRAIESAAKKGGRTINAHEVDRLRAPVGMEVYEAVYQRLRALGYSVVRRPTGIGSQTSCVIGW